MSVVELPKATQQEYSLRNIFSSFLSEFYDILNEKNCEEAVIIEKYRLVTANRIRPSDVPHTEVAGVSG